MRRGDLITGTKWVGGVLGYIVASLALSVFGSVSILFALSRGEPDDSPGMGLIGVFLAGQLFLILLVLGFLLLVEIIYSRFLFRTSMSWSRAVLRQILGLLSLVGPSMIFWFWPPIGFRSNLQSNTEEPLLLTISGLLLLTAVALPLKSRKRDRDPADSAA